MTTKSKELSALRTDLTFSFELFLFLEIWRYSNVSIDALFPSQTWKCKFYQIWWHFWTALCIFWAVPWYPPPSVGPDSYLLWFQLTDLGSFNFSWRDFKWMLPKRQDIEYFLTLTQSPFVWWPAFIDYSRESLHSNFILCQYFVHHKEKLPTNYCFFEHN